jgi:CMP-N-acetylneuraminic acid synthetase
MNILAIIPARCASKGVPKKNIKLLNGVPLIGYSIKSAKESNYINKIIVSTDCKETQKIAQTFGIEVPFLRPKELATDKSLDIEFVKHTLEWLQVHENYVADMIVLLRPTTPIRESDIVDDAIKQMLSSQESSSLRSSHKSPESPFKWFKIKNGLYTPIHEDYTLADTNKPRQSFESIYIPNGYVDILKPQTISKYNDIYGDKILSFVTEVSYEIDTMEDFSYIEYLAMKDIH